MVWIPGRNDAFFHVHVLDRILAAGFDVYALDLRRCGRAKYSLDGDEITPELMAHDSYDFSEYFEEIDATLKFIKSPHELPSTGNIVDGGCGTVYDSVVMYAHSTGGLVAALYGGAGGGGWRGAIDGYVFNSPFWNWNVSWYEKFAIQGGSMATTLLPGVNKPEFVLSEGGGPSMYSNDLHATYGFPTSQCNNQKCTLVHLRNCARRYCMMVQLCAGLSVCLAPERSLRRGWPHTSSRLHFLCSVLFLFC